MTKLNICTSEIIMVVLTAVALSCIVFFNRSNAETMSSSKYQVLDKSLMTEYKSAKIRCNLLLGNAKALCNTKAEGLKEITKAELEARFTPKSGEIKKDNTVKFYELDHKNNSFITIEFDNIYHVKA